MCVPSFWLEPIKFTISLERSLMGKVFTCVRVVDMMMYAMMIDDLNHVKVFILEKN